MNKKVLRSLILVFILIVGIFVFNSWRKPEWQSKVFAVTSEMTEHTVFDEKLSAGSTIVFRLDLKPDANGKLVLYMPDNLEYEWVTPYKQSNQQAVVHVEESGQYRLLLITDPSEVTTTTPPEIEVNWCFEKK